MCGSCEVQSAGGLAGAGGLMVFGAMPLLPTTKMGSGDKERAYVIRQNLVLKTMLIMAAVLTGLGMLLCCTVYEVHVQRRVRVDDAREHREEEHTSHMRVMRLSTMLQQRLKDEVHDMHVLTTYRAWLLRAVGEYQQRVLATLANCSKAAALPQLGADFDKQLDGLIHRLWEDVVSEGKAATGQLHNITAAIMGELRQEVSEKADFDVLMRSQGEEPSPRWPPTDEDAPDGYGGRVEDEDSSLGVALEAFHRKLLSNSSLLLALEPTTLQKWLDAYEDAMRVLGDEEKEADMVRINARLGELIAEAGAPPFSKAELEAEGDSAAGAMSSELDYFTDLLYRAKLAPHRDGLLQLLDQWQSGIAPLSAPLERVEQLIDDNVLQPDVLLAGNYDYNYQHPEHYHYENE